MVRSIVSLSFVEFDMFLLKSSNFVFSLADFELIENFKEIPFRNELMQKKLMHGITQSISILLSSSQMQLKTNYSISLKHTKCSHFKIMITKGVQYFRSARIV